MKEISVASPLFLLRFHAQKDLFSVLKNIAAIGFDGVEFIGLFGHPAKEVRDMLNSLGLQALGDHIALADYAKEPDRMLEDHLTLGCKYLTIGGLPADLTEDKSEFHKTMETFCSLIEKTKKAGITPLYHNHHYDVAPQEKGLMDKVLMELVPHGLRFEPDLGWMVFKNVSPAFYLKKYKDVCPVLHLKDIYAEDLSLLADYSPDNGENAAPGGEEHGYFSFCPTGEGIVDYPSLLPLCRDCNPSWLVPDHDCAYDRDPYEELSRSLQYTKNLFQIK